MNQPYLAAVRQHPVAHPGDRVQFNWQKTAWLYLFLLPSIAFTWEAASWKLSLTSALLTFFIVGIGHSVGLHRGIIHRSYRCSRAFRNLTAYLFVLTGLGSPLAWLKLHYIRDYWQNRQDTPRYFQYHHSLWKDYWWYLHVSYHPADLERYAIPADDLEDPWLNWLDKTWYLHVLGACGLVWLLFGWQTLIVTMTLRISLTMLGHWFVGYVTHTYGYSQYSIAQADVSGKNTWFLGLISFGEGFHNNHHAHPSSARFGLKWYEVDFSWYMIRLFQSLGLVWKVEEAGKGQTLKQRATPHLTRWSWPWQDSGRKRAVRE
ncbi:acyl-CoA desaturase [Pontibacter litorisediminis]|uniref:acyl-CoA desaturase n=1 Tax=Pontibacter litorisediminis TaxID=1846260 RepID=UPI0023ED20EB|nr:acyl-CoA desaturase [Pontibacter litorisediminis]